MAASSLVINFNLPGELIQLLRPAPVLATPAATQVSAPTSLLATSTLAPATPAAPTLAPAIPIIPAATGSTAPCSGFQDASLIPVNRIPGPELSLEDFCRTYRLTEGVHTKLDNDGYSGSHTFEYATWKDLIDAGMKTGEIAQMKHALLNWSVPHAL